MAAVHSGGRVAGRAGRSVVRRGVSPVPSRSSTVRSPSPPGCRSDRLGTTPRRVRKEHATQREAVQHRADPRRGRRADQLVPGRVADEESGDERDVNDLQEVRTALNERGVASAGRAGSRRAPWLTRVTSVMTIEHHGDVRPDPAVTLDDMYDVKAEVDLTRRRGWHMWMIERCVFIHRFTECFWDLAEMICYFILALRQMLIDALRATPTYVGKTR